MVFDTCITWSWLAFCILTLIFFFFFLVFFHYFYSRRFKHVFSRTLWNKALGKVLHLIITPLIIIWLKRGNTKILLCLIYQTSICVSPLALATLLDLPNLHLCWTLGLCHFAWYTKPPFVLDLRHLLLCLIYQTFICVRPQAFLCAARGGGGR